MTFFCFLMRTILFSGISLLILTWNLIALAEPGVSADPAELSPEESSSTAGLAPSAQAPAAAAISSGEGDSLSSNGNESYSIQPLAPGTYETHTAELLGPAAGSDHAPITTAQIDSDDEAEDASPEEEGNFFELEFEDGDNLRLTVTGTRNPIPVENLPATVTVFEAEDFDFYQVQGLQDLLRYEPGVSVDGSLQRYGAQDVNIRGIEGNRVLFQVDNIRLPELFSFGGLPPNGFRVGRGDYVDFAALQAVEVLRGPASTLYGSDALGGVISYRSLQPSDLLEDGDDFAGDVSTNFSSASGGFDSAARFAVQEGEAAGVFVISRRDGREADTFGAPQFSNGIDTGDTNLYGNLVYSLDETSSLSFILEDINRRTAYDIAAGNLAASQTSSTGENRIDRTRVSLAYEFNNPGSASFLQFARAQLYYQTANTSEVVSELRPSGAGAFTGQAVRRDSFNQFIADSYGGEVQLRSDFATGDWQHRLTYGFDFSETDNSRPRDRTQTLLSTGATTRDFGVFGTFPEKDFADGDTLRLGLYLQDEVAIGNFNIIAGLRFDHYDLQTTDDAAFKGEAAGLTASAISPRIAVLYEATPELSIYGQYARGFRAPLYSEITSGFTNLAFGYETISSPNLEPETSDSFEVGIRGNFPQFDFGITGFYNTYDNFISTGELVGVRPPGIQQFQTVNIEGARIYGVELTGEYRFSPEPHGFSLLGNLAYTVGDDLEQNQPLTSIDPLRAVVGLRYRAPEDVWRAEFIGTFAGTARVPDNNTLFTPGGYAVFDLIGSYNGIPNLGLNLGVYNLFDAEYYQYSEVRNIGVQANDAGVAQYTQPGINLRLGVNFSF